MSETYAEKTKPVVACLDGGEDGDRALRYAIQEARRLGTGVRLIHVPLDVIPYAPMIPLYSAPSLREIGAHILKDAFDRCQEVAPDVFVEGALGAGPRIPALVAESQSAARVVVGTREWHSYRVFGRSTSLGLASRAACPVVAVPPAWSEGTALSGRIVVGVDELGGPPAVLRHAFEVARLRKAELDIVHAWMAPVQYEIAAGWADAEAWRAATTAQLYEATAEVRAEFSDVSTRMIVNYEVAGPAIAEAAAGSDLIILGRHRTLIPLPHRLGSVARSAIHAGLAPVEIVAPEPVEEQQDQTTS